MNLCWQLYTVNEKDNYHHGVGIVIEKELNPKFKKINNRICRAEIKINKNRKLYFISAYAPTAQVSKKNPKIKEEFFEALDASIKDISNRHIIIVGGGFQWSNWEGNAKRGNIH